MENLTRKEFGYKVGEILVRHSDIFHKLRMDRMSVIGLFYSKLILEHYLDSPFLILIQIRISNHSSILLISGSRQKINESNGSNLQ